MTKTTGCSVKNYGLTTRREGCVWKYFEKKMKIMAFKNYDQIFFWKN